MPLYQETFTEVDYKLSISLPPGKSIYIDSGHINIPNNFGIIGSLKLTMKANGITSFIFPFLGGVTSSGLISIVNYTFENTTDKSIDIEFELSASVAFSLILCFEIEQTPLIKNKATLLHKTWLRKDDINSTEIVFNVHNHYWMRFRDNLGNETRAIQGEYSFESSDQILLTQLNYTPTLMTFKILTEIRFVWLNNASVVTDEYLAV